VRVLLDGNLPEHSLHSFRAIASRRFTSGGGPTWTIVRSWTLLKASTTPSSQRIRVSGFSRICAGGVSASW
jgi:hypothetical protein